MKRRDSSRILGLLSRKRVDYLSQADITALTLPVRMNLEMLATGRLTDDQFVDLNQANIATWCIGQQLARYRGDTEETGQIALRVRDVTEAAADDLAAIGERRNERGNYVARAEELARLQQVADWYEQLLPNVPRGALTEALDGAQHMVKEALQ